MTNSLPHMSETMYKSMEFLFEQQKLILHGQTKLIQETGVKFAKRSISAKDMKDGQYYVVASPTLIVDIGTTKFNLLVGTVIVKSQDHLVVMKGCMTFAKQLDSNTFFSPLREAGFIIKSLEGKIATL